MTRPALNSAVDVMIFIVEPGATAAVSAKSLTPALLAMARIWPVDGWIATIELPVCMATAARAAVSAFGLIVVESVGKLPGAMRIRLAVRHRAARLGLDLHVKTGIGALVGRRGRRQQAGDGVEPGVVVALEVLAA